MKEAPKDDIEFMRRTVKSALRSVNYHEKELLLAHKKLSFAKAMIARGDYQISLDEALREYEGSEDDKEPKTPIEWVRTILGSAVWSTEYHERELAAAHNEVAIIKTVLLRGKYTEIDLVEMASEVAEEKKS